MLLKNENKCGVRHDMVCTSQNEKISVGIFLNLRCCKFLDRGGINTFFSHQFVVADGALHKPFTGLVPDDKCRKPCRASDRAWPRDRQRAMRSPCRSGSPAGSYPQDQQGARKGACCPALRYRVCLSRPVFLSRAVRSCTSFPVCREQEPRNRRSPCRKARPQAGSISRTGGGDRSRLPGSGPPACTAQGTPITAIFVILARDCGIFERCKERHPPAYRLPASRMRTSDFVMTAEDGFSVQGSSVTVTTASIRPSSRAFARIAVTAPPLCRCGISKAAFAESSSRNVPSVSFGWSPVRGQTA